MIIHISIFLYLRSTPVGSGKHPLDVYRPESLRSASVGAGKRPLDVPHPENTQNPLISSVMTMSFGHIGIQRFFVFCGSRHRRYECQHPFCDLLTLVSLYQFRHNISTPDKTPVRPSGFKKSPETLHSGPFVIKNTIILLNSLTRMPLWDSYAHIPCKGYIPLHSFSSVNYLSHLHPSDRPFCKMPGYPSSQRKAAANAASRDIVTYIPLFRLCLNSPCIRFNVVPDKIHTVKYSCLKSGGNGNHNVFFRMDINDISSIPNGCECLFPLKWNPP